MKTFISAIFLALSLAAAPVFAEGGPAPTPAAKTTQAKPAKPEKKAAKKGKHHQKKEKAPEAAPTTK